MVVVLNVHTRHPACVVVYIKVTEFSYKRLFDLREVILGLLDAHLRYYHLDLTRARIPVCSSCVVTVALQDYYEEVTFIRHHLDTVFKFADVDRFVFDDSRL